MHPHVLVKFEFGVWIDYVIFLINVIDYMVYLIIVFIMQQNSYLEAQCNWHNYLAYNSVGYDFWEAKSASHVRHYTRIGDRLCYYTLSL